MELAGAIAELAHLTLASEFRRFDPTSLRLILIEAAPRILPPFDESLAAAAKAKIEKLGVEVRTGAPVEKVDAEGIILKGERIRSKNLFWAAGVKPSPVAKWLGAEADKAGRVKVLAGLLGSGASRGLRRGRHCLVCGERKAPAWVLPRSRFSKAATSDA